MEEGRRDRGREGGTEGGRDRGGRGGGTEEGGTEGQRDRGREGWRREGRREGGRERERERGSEALCGQGKICRHYSSVRCEVKVKYHCSLVHSLVTLAQRVKCNFLIPHSNIPVSFFPLLHLGLQSTIAPSFKVPVNPSTSKAHPPEPPLPPHSSAASSTPRRNREQGLSVHSRMQQAPSAVLSNSRTQKTPTEQGRPGQEEVSDGSVGEEEEEEVGGCERCW